MFELQLRLCRCFDVTPQHYMAEKAQNFRFSAPRQSHLLAQTVRDFHRFLCATSHHSAYTGFR